ncbi:dihydropteroate synthase [Hoeflea sp.]|uniref:dihydropteroate synthase n=1 Tax=Hoeflea sp. TaxID=1940281 RepID=UPI0019A08959|nr:dihydropteroate synthase [Hoeflea sp.]MBC7286237.1 dihydropteroate synthase [Hoeflea sp.]
MAVSFFDKAPYIMGVVNVTPDSFSDGGVFYDPDRAIAHGLQLAEDGADILDIGGESTRPNAAPVTPQEEIDRVLPVIEGLNGCGKIISIDTRNAATMRAALKAGVTMINDVTALQGDADSLAVAAKSNAAICLMHMQGDPRTMQNSPRYGDVVAEVKEFLAGRIGVCEVAGIERSRLVIDPGIGFGKTLGHNLALLSHINSFDELGVPVLLGLSRKSFISAIFPDTPPTERLPGSLAGALWGLQQGASIFRVHDVAATRQAFAVFEAISAAEY